MCYSPPPCVRTGMLGSAMFLVVWKLLPARLPEAWPLGRQLRVMVLASLSLWASIAVCVVVLRSLVVTSTGSAVAVGITGCSLHVLVSPAVATCWSNLVARPPPPPCPPPIAVSGTPTPSVMRIEGHFGAVMGSWASCRVSMNRAIPCAA
jgi:hypothetical protein